MTTRSRLRSGAPISTGATPRPVGAVGGSLPATGPLLCALLCLLLAGGTAAAQETRAKPSDKHFALIFGTVFAADGHLAYGVPVNIRRADQKKTLQEAMSDHSGEFAFRVAPGPGDYLVWADVKPSKKRDKSKEDKHLPGPGVGQPGRPEVRVHIDNEERVDISLHLTE